MPPPLVLVASITLLGNEPVADIEPPAARTRAFPAVANVLALANSPPMSMEPLALAIIAGPLKVRLFTLRVPACATKLTGPPFMLRAPFMESTHASTKLPGLLKLTFCAESVPPINSMTDGKATFDDGTLVAILKERLPDAVMVPCVFVTIRFEPKVLLIVTSPLWAAIDPALVRLAVYTLRFPEMDVSDPWLTIWAACIAKSDVAWMFGAVPDAPCGSAF